MPMSTPKSPEPPRSSSLRDQFPALSLILGIDTHFTDSTAWEFIARRLECGEDVEVIELDKPKGAKGYVMTIALQPGVPALYVKLQLGSGKIIGRSFHYSEHG